MPLAAEPRRIHLLQTPAPRPGAGDPRPPAGALRAARGAAARRAGRGAGAHRAAPRTPTTATATSPTTACASAFPPGTRSATRRSKRSRTRSAPAASRTPRRRGSRRSCGSSTATTSSGCATRRARRRFPSSSSCPGVGRKTAACVLIFSFGRPEIPVDTHVERVGKRLGLISPDASFDQAHDEMRAIVDPEDAWELHINLIAHGRAICRPQPRCDECALLRMCPTAANCGIAPRPLERLGHGRWIDGPPASAVAHPPARNARAGSSIRAAQRPAPAAPPGPIT